MSVSFTIAIKTAMPGVPLPTHDLRLERTQYFLASFVSPSSRNSTLIIDRSFSDSDDWGTPRKPSNDVGFNSDDVVQFADSDEEMGLRRGPKSSKKKPAKKPAKKAVRFSHSAAASEDGGEY